MIRDLTVTDDGAVSFTFLLAPEDPATLVRQARAAVQGIDGVRAGQGQDHRHQSRRPRAARRTRRRARPPRPPSLRVRDQRAARTWAGSLAVSSGKGGVGKSTVAVNLAVALAAEGARVGVMDADIYGPNIPRMFGVFEKPLVIAGKIQPLEAYGVKLMSLGFLVERDAPAIWRGPIIMKIVQQFLRDVSWGELDYFIVDLPPGTGDAQLSLVQATQVAGAIIVTTPQEMAVGDALRGARMFERVGVPVIGVVENMSGVHRSRDRQAVRALLLRRRAAAGGGDRRPAARQRPAPAAARRAGRRGAAACWLRRPRARPRPVCARWPTSSAGSARARAWRCPILRG